MAGAGPRAQKDYCLLITISLLSITLTFIRFQWKRSTSWAKAIGFMPLNNTRTVTPQPRKYSGAKAWLPRCSFTSFRAKKTISSCNTPHGRLHTTVQTLVVSAFRRCPPSWFGNSAVAASFAGDWSMARPVGAVQTAGSLMRRWAG